MSLQGSAHIYVLVIKGPFLNKTPFLLHHSLVMKIRTRARLV